MKLSACSMPANRSRTLGAASAGAAVGAVDVEPHAELGGTRRPTPARSSTTPALVVPRWRRSRTAAHGRRRSSASTRGSQRVAVQPALLVGGHERRRRRPSPAPPRRSTECAPVDATISPRVRSMRAVGALAPAEPGGDQRAEVAGRAAADEHAAGVGGQAGQVGDPAQRLVLGEAPRRRPPATTRRRCSTRRRRGRTGSTPRSARPARTTGTADGRRRCTPGPSTSANTRSASRPPMPAGGDRVAGHRRAARRGVRPLSSGGGSQPHALDRVADDRLR